MHTVEMVFKVKFGTRDSIEKCVGIAHRSNKYVNAPLW